MLVGHTAHSLSSGICVHGKRYVHQPDFDTDTELCVDTIKSQISHVCSKAFFREFEGVVAVIFSVVVSVVDPFLASFLTLSFNLQLTWTTFFPHACHGTYLSMSCLRTWFSDISRLFCSVSSLIILSMFSFSLW